MFARLRYALLALVALTSLSCSRVRASPGTRVVDPSSAGPKRVFPPLTDEDVSAIVESVSTARAIPARRPVKITRLTREEFRAEIAKQSEAASDKDEVSLEEAFLVGFDFLPPPSKRQGIATSQEVMVEQVRAFYDVDRDAVFLPEAEITSESEALLQKAVLAHEIHHALQAQNFALAKAAKPKSTDEALANLALIEGDAMVAMAAYVGNELGAPVRRTLRRLREATEDVPRASIARHQPGALDRALDLSREMLAFPYESGMLFVSDVFRAGGFELVDKLYSRKPSTTESILHPEKFLAGETSRPVKELAPPAGHTAIGSDVMGELATRVLLERCIPAKTAEIAAAGWNGDRYTALKTKSGDLAIAWSTAWDTEPDAVEFERALQDAEQCFADNAAGQRKIGKKYSVRRRGSVVAFVRGFDDATGDAVAGKLLDLPQTAPPTVVFSDKKIPPRVKLPEPKKGSIDDGIYRNDWLGISGTIPKGMQGTIGDTVDLLVEHPNKVVAAGIDISTRVSSEKMNEAAFADAEKAFKKIIKRWGQSLRRTGGGDIETAMGPGVDRLWQVGGTAIRFRTTLVPICGGTGSIVFIQVYDSQDAKKKLDDWVASFSLSSGKEAPACEYLDPK